MAYNLITAEDRTRDFLREPRISSAIDGENFESATIRRNLAQLEREGYWLEIQKNKSRFLKSYSFSGTGSESYDLPGYGTLSTMRICMRRYKLVDADAEYREYKQIDLDERATIISSSNVRCYYPMRNTIGILPVPSTSANLKLYYYEKYNVMSTTEYSDLDELVQEWMCMKAALLELEARADANASVFAARVQDYEINVLNNLDTDPRLAQELAVGEQKYVSRSGDRVRIIS